MGACGVMEGVGTEVQQIIPNMSHLQRVFTESS